MTSEKGFIARELARIRGRDCIGCAEKDAEIAKLRERIRELELAADHVEVARGLPRNWH